MNDMAPPSNKGIHNSNVRESKVTFSPTQNERRSDSLDQLNKMERRGNKSQLGQSKNNDNEFDTMGERQNASQFN